MEAAGATVNFVSADSHGFFVTALDLSRPVCADSSGDVPLLNSPPTFPSLSTRKSRRPQFSHSECSISDCRPKRNARKFIHCKREGCAASDRARLVLRQNERAAPVEPKGLRWAAPVGCR